MTAAITALAHRGLCRRDAADALGWPYVTFCKRVRRLGLHPLFKDAEWKARSRAGIAREKARACSKRSGEI